MSPLSLLIVWSLMTIMCLTEGLYLSPRDKCVTNAHFNETERKCRCDNGYKGSARLCCGPEDQGVCHLISDPILNTAHDVISEISFPCTTSIAVIQKHEEGVLCSVKVNIAGPYLNNGALFYDSAAFFIQYGDFQQLYKIETIKSMFDPKNFTEPVPHKMVKIGGYDFKVSYDIHNARWLVSGCGGQLVYRQPVPNLDRQVRPPGLCVIAPNNNIAQQLSKGEVCNVEPGFNPQPYANKEQAILASMILGYSDIPADQNMDPRGYKDMCGQVSNTFSACKDDEAKANAINKCGPILLGFKRRQCLNKSENQVFSVFSECLKAVCLKDGESCKKLKDNNDVKNCVPQVQNC